MAALPAGVQYALSSEHSYKENKELVFVKLTDSALKAIEDFLRNRDKLAKPTIQFLPGNEGKFSIPVGGNGPSGESTFHFSTNSNAEMEGPQGSFECVRSGGAKRLESCGPLPRRMRVQANDDSYEATKDRMARTVAAEQSKCTRVIKPNQTDIGRRVKVRSAHTAHVHPIPPAPAPLPRPERPVERPERPVERPERPIERPERPVERPDRPVERPERLVERPERPVERPERPVERPVERPERSIERPERPVERPERPVERPERPVERPERPVERPERPVERPERPVERPERPVERPERPAERPAPPTHRPPPPPNHQQQRPPPAHSDVSRRPIKERVIQLLALKPFKKPELYSRLKSEGIKEKEWCNVNKQILPQIGTLKDNCYHLRRNIWNDVNEDWSFYTEEEKRILKRRKPQNLTPPLSSDSTNSLSPSASPSAGKRAGGGAPGDDTPAAKKQRISHFNKKFDQRAGGGGSPSSGYATGGSGASSGERHASDNEDDRTSGVKKDNGYTLSFNTIKDLCPSPVTKTNGFRNSPPEEPTHTEKDITIAEPLDNTELMSVADDNPTDLEDIQRQYPPITSSSMRRQYKNKFAELYSEYSALYAKVARVAELFARLERQLKREQPHSPHRHTIEQRIVEEYKRLRSDENYQHERRRVDFLHLKLTHIKRAVHQYDQLRNLKTDRVSTASTTQAY